MKLDNFFPYKILRYPQFQLPSSLSIPFVLEAQKGISGKRIAGGLLLFFSAYIMVMTHTLHWKDESLWLVVSVCGGLLGFMMTQVSHPTIRLKINQANMIYENWSDGHLLSQFSFEKSEYLIVHSMDRDGIKDGPYNTVMLKCLRDEKFNIYIYSNSYRNAASERGRLYYENVASIFGVEYVRMIP